MQGRIVLVRHGETEANRCRRFAESGRISLTDGGRRQASELAVRLAREFQADLLLSSAYVRALQTSQILGTALGLKVEITGGLHERDFGCLKGHPYERMGELMLGDASYDPRQPWMWTPDGGESLNAVRLRAIAALEVARERQARDTIVVCHGAVIQSICAHISGEWRESWVPANCGFISVGVSRGGWGQPVICGGDSECAGGRF